MNRIPAALLLAQAIKKRPTGWLAGHEPCVNEKGGLII